MCACVLWELPYHEYFADSATHIHTHARTICVIPCSILRAIAFLNYTYKLYSILYICCCCCNVVKRINAKCKLEIWWIKPKAAIDFVNRNDALPCGRVKKKYFCTIQAHAKQSCCFIFVFSSSSSLLIHMNEKW